MKLRHILTGFVVVSLALSGVTVWLGYESFEAMSRVEQTEDRRHASILLAEELRQSSDDLTRFAHLFAHTGDERFADYFQQVLAIRNGNQPRPEGYEGIYWDFVIVDSSRLGQASGEALSLHERMLLLDFSPTELALLDEALHRSDALAVIEREAFDAIRGVSAEPDLALAEELLHSDDYYEAKAQIMAPIAEFEERVNARTAQELAATRAEALRLLEWSFLSSGLLFIVLVAVAVVMQRRVVRRTTALARAATLISDGDLDVRSHVRGRDELGTLGTTFDEMVSRLAASIDVVNAAKERMEQELNVGREIQMSMLPLIFPAFPDRREFDIYAALEPAREVGGDFYDFFFIDADLFYFCIGDVSDKGVPAALFMAVAKALLKSKASEDPSPASIVTRVNAEIARDNNACMFVTLFLGILDLRSGQVTFCNAGHNPPFVRRQRGTIEKLSERHGPVVGAAENVIYRESTLSLYRGDQVFLYTDGVTEAMNPNRELFSEQRLVTALSDARCASPKPCLREVLKTVTAFQADAEQFDDVTALALQLLVDPTDPEFPRLDLVLHNRHEDVARASAAFEAFADEQDVPRDIISKCLIVLDELLTNVMSYAYTDDDAHEITLTTETARGEVRLTIVDDGRPFNPGEAGEPQTDQSLEDRAVGGLGVHLVRQLMDHLHYRREAGTNIVTVSKQWTTAD